MKKRKQKMFDTHSQPRHNRMHVPLFQFQHHSHQIFVILPIKSLKPADRLLPGADCARGLATFLFHCGGASPSDPKWASRCKKANLCLKFKKPLFHVGFARWDNRQPVPLTSNSFERSDVIMWKIKRLTGWWFDPEHHSQPLPPSSAVVSGTTTSRVRVIARD